jgi:AsmA protein
MRVIKIVTAGALVGAALLLIFGIPANFLVGALQARIEAFTGYRLRIDGGARIRLWPSPTVLVRDITLLYSKEETRDQFKVEAARVVLSFSDLIRGHPRITELTITHPMLRLPLARDRSPTISAPASVSESATRDSLAIDRIRVEDGSVGFYSESDRLENSISRVNLDASLAAANVTGSLYWGGQMLQFELKSKAWPEHLQGQSIPVKFSLRAPELVEQPLTASAELRARTSSIAINALSGGIGQSSFNGWATLDFTAGKPLIKGDLDFDQLRILPAAERDRPGQPPEQRSTLSEPWSDQEFRLDGLNFFDAEIRISAAEFALASFRFAPFAVATNLNKGLLKVALVNTGLYGGTTSGAISVDASGSVPAHSIHVRFDGVDALPLLSEVANFQSLEGTMQAALDVDARGGSQRAAISSLAGIVDVRLLNGAVRGIDLVKLMRELTSTILNGWQQNASDKTPLSELNAHFRLANGIATTDDLRLSGPIVRMTGNGSIDLPAKKLQFKVDPRLVAGQGSNSSVGTTGLGVPVLIEGSWSEPRIYPDVAGILDDPVGVYKQLKATGKGLFGDVGSFDNLLGGVGKMFNVPPETHHRGVSGDDQ